MRNRKRFRQCVIVIIPALLLIALYVSHSLWQRQQRYKCKSNLRFLGEGVYGYHESSGAFPPGTVPHNQLPPEKRLSWLVETIPFFEGDNPSARIDRTKSWDSIGNLTVCNDIAPSLFVCPLSPIKFNQGTSITNYVGIAGLGEDAALLAKSDKKAGVFGYERHVSLSDIKDGMNNTMMVIETSLELGAWSAGGRPTVRGLDSHRQPYIGTGCQFGGLHPHGSMALFADGSVHFLQKSIAPQVFESLSTIAGVERGITTNR